MPICSPEDKTLWTYDELLEICRAAEKANPDVIPMGLFAGSQSSDAWYYSWFLANGVDLCNEDLTATAFNNDENREKSLQVLDPVSRPWWTRVSPPTAAPPWWTRIFSLFGGPETC